MDESELTAEMRLWALEVLTCNMFVTLCASTSDPAQSFRAVFDTMALGARKRAFPGFDPAESDQFSAELEAAVARLRDMASSQMLGGLKIDPDA